MPGASLHVVGDLAPSGLFTVSRMPEPLDAVSVEVNGVAISPSSGVHTFRVPPSATPGAELLVSAAGLSRAFEVADPGPTTWVILLAGQSNMLCRAAADAGAWPAAAQYVTQQCRPTAPASSIMSAGGDSGPFLIAKRFAADFLAARPADSIVLVPGAVGGTSFSNNRWNPGDDLYDNLITIARAVMFGHPTWRLRAMLVQGFETDGQNSMAAAEFRSALDAFVAGVRFDLQSAQLPIVFGEFPAGFVGSSPARIAIRDEILLAPSRIPFTAIASSRSPSAAGDDRLHFTQAGSLLMGDRLAPALASADGNTLSG